MRAATRRQHGLIHSGAAFDDDTVHWYFLTGPDLNYIADQNFFNWNVHFLAITDDAGGLGLQAQQLLNC